MLFNKYEIRDIKDFNFISKGNVDEYSLDFDSLVQQNGKIIIAKINPLITIGNIIIITDNEFGKNIPCLIKEVNETNIVTTDLNDLFNAKFIFQNVTIPIVLETYIKNILETEYFYNDDILQIYPYFNFNAITSTMGTILELELDDDKNKIMPIQQMLEKMMLEYNIFITHNINFTTNEINFNIQKNQTIDLYIDSSLPDIIDFEIKMNAKNINKLDIYSQGTDDLYNLHSVFMLLSDDTITQDYNHVKRIYPVIEGDTLYTKNQTFDPLTEAEKFFNKNNKNDNEIYFKIKKDSKIIDNQNQFELGAKIIIKINNINIESTITGVNFQTDTNYNSYICGFKRSKITKQLRRKQVL